MRMVADQKRRVVLPKSVQPGDVFECIQSGDRIVMEKLKLPEAFPPPVSTMPLDPEALRGVDLDEPPFAPLNDAGVD